MEINIIKTKADNKTKAHMVIKNNILISYDVGYKTEIILPEGITKIGEDVFKNTHITKIVLPESLHKIGDGAFDECRNLKEVILPKQLEVIGSFAFAKCTNLLKLQLPDSIISIKDYAFVGSGLTEINLPESLKVIGDAAFKNTDLRNVTIPPKTILGKSIFKCCSSLSKLIFKGENVVIPEECCFMNRNLNTVNLDCVTEIKNDAFRGCISLSFTELPDSVKRVGNRVFEDCINIKKLNIKDVSVFIGNSVFQNTGVESVNISAPKAAEIPNSMFYYCKSLKSLTLKGKITAIGNKCFSETEIDSINIPESVKEIRSRAFTSCPKLNHISFGTDPVKLTKIGYEAFANTGIKQMIFPDSVEIIGSGCLENCYNLTYVSLPKDLTIIRESMFANCTTLKNICCGKIEIAENSSFAGCTNLAHFDFDNIVYLGCNSFRGSGIKEVVFSEHFFDPTYNVDAEYSPGFNANGAFKNCECLTLVDFSKCGKHLTKISESMFKGCNNLQTVKLPGSVDFFDDLCLEGTAINKLVFNPDSEKLTINPNAFANTNIDEITFTGKCKIINIANDAFKHSSIKKINLPDFVYELSNVQAALKNAE